ncbi:hypothetical protein G210_4520 [Candida maltosa Xu316]|uniref:Uncharacterized protein n=1 Tax=Candida maltosa (strain Xu316) TaxID=1245528 RepID=M3HS89_CANMX|nr:hypothetical protein G210_4520 [Candida maltosa Xu316]
MSQPSRSNNPFRTGESSSRTSSNTSNGYGISSDYFSNPTFPPQISRAGSDSSVNYSA